MKTRINLLTILLMFLFLLLAITTASAQSIYTEPLTGMQFQPITGGTFMMGSIDTSVSRPVHQVTVGDFYLATYETTFAAYDLFCEATERDQPSDEGWGRDNRPVINVSWDDAVDFSVWLSQQSGKRFRLPSEAEWEYAARAGVTTKYSWGDTVGTNNANCKDCGSSWDYMSTAPVGAFTANPSGLFDMEGNVYEWCLDTMHRDYVGAPTDGSAFYDGDIKRHITRSGSWEQPAFEILSTVRCWDIGNLKDTAIGFRLLMESP